MKGGRDNQAGTDKETSRGIRGWKGEVSVGIALFLLDLLKALGAKTLDDTTEALISIVKFTLPCTLEHRQHVR